MSPELDIVVVTYNSGRWLPLFDSITRECTAVHHRIIYVDNGSQDNSADWATIKLHWNQGYSAAANAGASIGTAPVIAFLNPDVIVSPGWDHALLNELASGASAVAPTYVNERGELWETYPDWVCGACLLTPRITWRSKPFDDRFYLGGEDVDYCWTLRKMDRRVAQSEFRVLHYGGATVRHTPFSALARDRHLRLLKEKWGRLP